MGLRPGEKMYEELLIDHENVEETEHQRILKSYEIFYNYNQIFNIFNDLKRCVNDNQISELLSILIKYVDDYKPNLNSIN